MKRSTCCLFAYGSLVVPEIFEAVTGNKPRALSATLSGYVRGLVSGEVYPGIAVCPGVEVSGALIWLLKPRPFLGLLLEGDDYALLRETVLLQ